MRLGLTIFGLFLMLVGVAGMTLGGLMIFIYGIPFLFGIVFLISGLARKSYKQCYVCGTNVESGNYKRHLTEAHNMPINT